MATGKNGSLKGQPQPWAAIWQEHAMARSCFLLGHCAVGSGRLTGMVQTRVTLSAKHTRLMSLFQEAFSLSRAEKSATLCLAWLNHAGLHRPRRSSVRTRQTRPLCLYGRERQLPRPRPCPSVSPLRRVKGSFAGLRPPLTRLRGRLPWA